MPMHNAKLKSEEICISGPSFWFFLILGLYLVVYSVCTDYTMCSIRVRTGYSMYHGLNRAAGGDNPAELTNGAPGLRGPGPALCASVV